MYDYREIFSRMPHRVTIGDVTLRDGFQCQEKRVSTEAKIFYLSELVFAGCKNIEVTNLGNPFLMPQFEDAEAVMSYARSDLFKDRCQRRGIDYEEICFTAVTIRETAVDEAVQLCDKGIGPDRLLMMVSTEEEHHYVNSGTTIQEYWREAERSIRKCNDAGMVMCGTVSTIWGSPVGGPTDMRDALTFSRHWLDIGAHDIEHSDHDGSGTAPKVFDYFSQVLDQFPDPNLHVAHFHETKRIGSASVLAALQAGICRFEGSLGGIGGQPTNFFEDRPVPGTGRYYHVSPGFVPLEDLLVQVDEMGIEHGYDVDRVLWLGQQMEKTLERRLRSDAVRNGRTLKEGDMSLARPGLQERKRSLGEV